MPQISPAQEYLLKNGFRHAGGNLFLPPDKWFLEAAEKVRQEKEAGK